MACPHHGALCRSAALWLAIVYAGVLPACSPGASEASAQPARGIAVLASGIGAEYPVAPLVEFVTTAGFDPVILDWAWITYHWDRTNVAAVQELIAALNAAGVTTLGMYRPRSLERPDFAFQVNADGSPVTGNGFEICFSSPEARRWGASWGERILQTYPALHEIIVYNPRNLCECPACRAARETDPLARVTSVWTFLGEARARWREVAPDALLGVVATHDPEFWRQGVGIADVAHPYLLLMRDADAPGDVENALAVKALYPQGMGACLAKITWGETDCVPPGQLAELDRLCRDQGLGYALWTFDTPFLSSLYDPEAVCHALSLDYQALRPSLERLWEASAAAAGPPPVMPQFRYAAPMPGLAAVTAAELEQLGCTTIRRDAVLVHYQAGKALLAGQIADVLEQMNLLARRIIGLPVQVFGLVLPEQGAQLPEALSQQWANVDGTCCLVWPLAEDALPLQSDLDRHMIFPLMIHEGVDVGLKAEVLGGSLRPGTVSSRWWIEGIADYCAYRACQEFQPGSFGEMKSAYLDKGLAGLQDATVDLEAADTWWPAGGDARPGYAYAAAHYVIWKMSQEHGDGWIAETLKTLRGQPGGPVTGERFCQAAQQVLGMDIRPMVRAAETARVREFVAGLQ